MKVQIFANYSRAPKLEGIGVLVRKIIREEKKNAERISVVFVDDRYLLWINRKFLNHNYKTDVVSFDLGDDGTIEGEVYVSVDRAKVQSRRYGVTLKKELLRLVAHGVLHLTGWEDRTRSQKLLMRKRENALIEGFRAKRSKA